MEAKKSNFIILTERDENHKKLMLHILKNLSDTPLVLKGGTALYLGYGLNRFSEDLDFDSVKKINLLNKIKSSLPTEIAIDDINLKKDTDTVTKYMIKYHVKNTGKQDSLKIEISYRNPPSENQIILKDGIRFSSIERIIDNKLNAAFDGSNPRIKGRDLFDLHFLAKYYANHFDINFAKRLFNFSQDLNKLYISYLEDVQEDPLLNKIMDVEEIALELNEMAQDILVNRQMEILFKHDDVNMETNHSSHSLKQK